MHSRRPTAIRNWIFRHLPVHILVFAVACPACFASSWYANRRSCEALNVEAIFIGRVIKVSPKKHLSNGQLSPGYSIRYAVEEVLKGKVGQEVTGAISSNCGGCGPPPKPGERLLVFAGRDEDGTLWTGGGYELRPNDPANYSIVEPFRKDITPGKGSLYGRVNYTAPPVWNDQGQPVGGGSRAVPDLVIRAASESNTFTTRTAKDGTYEFKNLPNGRYTVTPDVERDWTYDRHFFAARYEPSIGDGSCANVTFEMHPTTRLKGRVKLSPGQQFGTPSDGTVSLQDIVAVPTGLQHTNEHSGIGAIVYPDGQFDIWPIPAGDYYVGINITKPPTPEMSYEPTYYPGVTDKNAARVVHLEPGEVKYIELRRPKFAQARLVHIVAIGMDGKPLHNVRVKWEDLQHPGDAINNTVYVDLDANGAGTMTVYDGITYHLHASVMAAAPRRATFCSEPVLVPAGSAPVHVRFVMVHTDDDETRMRTGELFNNCNITVVDAAAAKTSPAQ